MNICTKELIRSAALAALEDKAYALSERLERGVTTKVGKFAQPISVKEQREVIAGIDAICAAIENNRI